MASSPALRRLLSSNLVSKSLSFPILRPISTTNSSAFRLFNTNALRSSDNESDYDDRRSGRPFSSSSDLFISDVFAPFSANRNLSHLLNVMDQISATRGVGAAGLRRGFASRETVDAVHLRFDMPGLGKEDVKVSVEGNTLSIKGEGAKEDGDDEGGRYSSGIELPEKLFKADQIKAEMKNGVLKVVIPKVKEEDRCDVFHVKIE